MMQYSWRCFFVSSSWTRQAGDLSSNDGGLGQWTTEPTLRLACNSKLLLLITPRINKHIEFNGWNMKTGTHWLGTWAVESPERQNHRQNAWRIDTLVSYSLRKTRLLFWEKRKQQKRNKNDSCFSDCLEIRLTMNFKIEIILLNKSTSCSKCDVNYCKKL